LGDVIDADEPRISRSRIRILLQDEILVERMGGLAFIGNEIEKPRVRRANGGNVQLVWAYAPFIALRAEGFRAWISSSVLSPIAQIEGPCMRK
jgi:hypothetical protein